MDTRYRSLLSGGPECRGADSRVQVSGEWKIIDPSRLDAKRGVVEFRYADIDAAIETALKQLREESPVANSSSRAGWIRSAAEVLASSGTALVLKAQEETGRVEADLSLELARMQAFLESFIEEPSASPPGDPRGVAAMVLSSVWPLYHALQYSILNLIAGNPVILKPAERVTASVLEFFTLLRKSHPAWERVQVLAGDRELGRRLVCHEAISLVIFQGSFEAGMRVRQDTLSQPAKEVLLFLGAKNPVILLDSGPQSGTEEAILRDAFLGAGQHCLAASQVWVPEKNLEVFVESFHEKSKAFSIGGPGEGAFMGPLLDASITDRYFKFIGISEREGARIVMRGKNHATRTGGYFVTPTLAVFDSISEDQMRRSVSLQTEILAPHLSILAYRDEESLAEVLGRSSYGHSASIWGEPDRAHALAERLAFGRIGINRGLYDLDLNSTAQVFKRSGNHARLGRGLGGQLVRMRWTG